jgi:hypothetical protein
VVSDTVALLYHAGGELWVGIDVLSDHKERRRDLEIGQYIEHSFRIWVHGPVVEGEVCAHRDISFIRLSGVSLYVLIQHWQLSCVLADRLLNQMGCLLIRHLEHRARVR